jgi:hypothetical protein
MISVSIKVLIGIFPAVKSRELIHWLFRMEASVVHIVSGLLAKGISVLSCDSIAQLFGVLDLFPFLELLVILSYLFLFLQEVTLVWNFTKEVISHDILNPVVFRHLVLSGITAVSWAILALSLVRLLTRVSKIC